MGQVQGMSNGHERATPDPAEGRKWKQKGSQYRTGTLGQHKAQDKCNSHTSITPPPRCVTVCILCIISQVQVQLLLWAH